MRTIEALLGLSAHLLHPVPDAADRSLTLAETEMLRNLNKEFRANELPEELYSQLVRNGAVMHMKNTCTPGPGDVKICTYASWVTCAFCPRCVSPAAVAAPVRHAAAAKSRTVHQTSSKELLRVLGHRCLKRLRLR
ncbi:hypothetical protein [Streptomyces cyaneochromogenes]|uniref:hypothetical protein n=1 Tax=Streptomyces cyaneochromogenes TaxID=2496836 RepID=UPI001E4189B4|nr:hypothetical protein [Streptomyces cyaneochromogenes]